ncbi:hypothetical protein LWI29_015625 [Acer saccharum]|uniref:Uncharacterized protein n=1 Tax=Acer saccharum TaxID=4024 RepID=A0AA39VBT3_ACESA|nr:hypothetical protein LWI29_015625 [Acer saccharum]
MCVTSEVPSKGTKVSGSAFCYESAEEPDASVFAQPEHAVPLGDVGERDDTAPTNVPGPELVDTSSPMLVGNSVPSTSTGTSGPSTLAVDPKGVRKEPPTAPIGPSL